MNFAVIASNRAPRATAVHQAVTRLSLHKECLAELSFVFSYSCKRLLPQPLSFDTHANYPGGGMGVLRPRVISLPSLLHSCVTLSLSFKLAKNISHPFNRLRTLCPKQPGYTPSCENLCLAPDCLSFATLLPLAVPCMRQPFSCLLIRTSSSLTTKPASANRSRPSLRTRAITSSPPNPPKKRSSAPREAI